MSWIRIPDRTYSPIYLDGRERDPYCINVRHTETVEMLRCSTRKEAEAYLLALDKAGYTLFDTKDPEKSERPHDRYISITINDFGILVIDAHTQMLLQRWRITPYYKRKVKKYVAALNEQEAA